MSVQQESLPSFLTTAELLSVQGLTGGNGSSGSGGGGGGNTTKDMPLSSSAYAPAALPHLVATSQQHVLSGKHQQQQQHHHQQQQQQSQQNIGSAKQRTSTIVSSLGDIKFIQDNSVSAPLLKTYAVQTVLNKAQTSTPITIPATVKLRTIPSGKQPQQTQQAQHQHIIIHQQPQARQQQQQAQIVESMPMKKRRISEVEVLSVTNAEIEEAEFIVSDVHEQIHHRQQPQQHQDQHEQLVDDVDTNDDGEEHEDDENEDDCKCISRVFLIVS